MNDLTILRIQIVPIKSGFLVSPEVNDAWDLPEASVLWSGAAVPSLCSSVQSPPLLTVLHLLHSCPGPAWPLVRHLCLWNLRRGKMWLKAEVVAGRLA